MDKTAQNAKGARSRPTSALLVCLLLLIIYNSNLRAIRHDDTVPARLLPFSMLLDGSLYLDKWVEPYLPGARGPYGIYFVTKSHGHWMSVYPIVAPLLVSPLYIAPAWWLARQHPSPAPGDIVLTTIVDTMEKISASLLAALSVGVLYLALRKIVTPHVSLLIALVYGLASNTWTISSQALWRHGLTELGFAFLLWALFRNPMARSYPFWVGLALAIAAANKPADVAIVLPFLVYFVRHRRYRLLLFCIPLFVLGVLTFAYDLHFFGRLLGGYPNPLSGGHSTSFHVPRTSFGDGFAGLWVSPNRGMLIYMPWTVLSLWGGARVWKEKMFGWGRYLIVGMAAVFLQQAGFGTWWGGWCFGPRYLTDLLPFFALFLIPIWPRIQAAPALKMAFVLATVAALWVQVVGAYYYPRGWWDGNPVSVDRDPRRLWDWSDTQISRSWKAGPASPDLYYGWYVLFSLRHGAGQSRLRLRPARPFTIHTRPCCFAATRNHEHRPVRKVTLVKATPAYPGGAAGRLPGQAQMRTPKLAVGITTKEVSTPPATSIIRFNRASLLAGSKYPPPRMIVALPTCEAAPVVPVLGGTCPETVTPPRSPSISRSARNRRDKAPDSI